MLRGIELLLQAPCLAGVDNAELERVPLRRSDYAAGEWLFTPHTPTRDLYFIAAGSIDVFDASVHDRLRPLLRAVPGDVLGEHRLGRRPSPLAARAVADTVVYRWPGEELAAFLASHAQVHDSLRFLDESRRLAGRMGFTWLGDGETVHGLARKHPALLIRALLLPMLALSAGLGILAAAGLSESGVTASVGAGLCALGLGLGVWRGLDWRNDFYVATDRRVVWLEKVIGIYDNRQESPLKMILSVAVDSGLIGRQLGFGDVTVRTYTGAITFKDAPHPHAFAATIESLGRRWQLSTRQSDRQTIHQALQQRLASGPPAETPPAYRPADADAQRALDEAGLDHWTLEVRFEEGGVITYRKHLAVLFAHLLLPTLLLLSTLALAATSFGGSAGYSGSSLFYPVVAISGVAAALWGAYEYADWANDLYQITPTHIVDVHRKPLGRESRKVAPLENILGTEVDRRGPIGIVLNFGDVVANVGASSFRFDGVLNPSAAQQDIVRAQEALVDRRLETDRRRRQDEMVEWLAAYHQQTTPPGTSPPPDDGHP
jgi:hypothetical protein